MTINFTFIPQTRFLLLGTFSLVLAFFVLGNVCLLGQSRYFFLYKGHFSFTMLAFSRQNHFHQLFQPSARLTFNQFIVSLPRYASFTHQVSFCSLCQLSFARSIFTCKFSLQSLDQFFSLGQLSIVSLASLHQVTFHLLVQFSFTR